MTRIVSGIIFYGIYSVMYLSPFIVLTLIDDALNLNLPQIIGNLGPHKQIPIILVGTICLFLELLAGYRAYLALDAYGDRDMEFWEAHSVSGVILKTHLSFLPIIGHFFKEKNEL